MSIPGNPSPYEVLGVARDASLVQIKAAHRKLTKTAHPDVAGGDINTFRQIQNAYDILSDPERRRRYDETGRQEQSRITPERVKTFLRSTMKDVIHAQRPDGSTDDPAQENILNKVLRSLANTRMELQRDRNEIARKLERANNLKLRMKTTGDSDLIGVVIDEEIAELQGQFRKQEDAFELSEEAEKVLRSYKYKVEPGPEGHFSPSSTTRRSGSRVILGYDQGRPLYGDMRSTDD